MGCYLHVYLLRSGLLLLFSSGMSLTRTLGILVEGLV
jgi:hypothetical protein